MSDLHTNWILQKIDVMIRRMNSKLHVPTAFTASRPEGAPSGVPS